MKKTIALMMLAVATPACRGGERLLQPLNDLGYGTVSGRIQALGMYRDFDNIEAGNNGANATLGFVLDYTTPRLFGLDAGAAWNYAAPFYDNNNTALLANDRINLLNEAWVRYTADALGLSNTIAQAGRVILNGAVFRADDFRQKARAVEAVCVSTRDVDGARLTAGHARRLSNWIQAGDRWDFNDFGEVFGTDYETDGVTWGEGTLTGIRGLELTVFDACAWDVANLLGARAAWSLTKESELIGSWRNESRIGRMESHSAHAYGVALRHKILNMTFEPGWFGVRGDNLLFTETTTGIDHPLGSSMIIYPSMFNGGSDTAYLKATTTWDTTVLYLLYNYTWHDHARTPYDGQELDLVVKQPIAQGLSVAAKTGFGWRDRTDDQDDTRATDLRLFLTYAF